MDTDAVTMVEYALMICMCALVAVAAISTLGVRLGSRYDAAAGILSAAAGRHPRGCDRDPPRRRVTDDLRRQGTATEEGRRRRLTPRAKFP